MTKQELANKLKEMYEEGTRIGGQAVAMIHMFGIQYGQQIDELNSTPREIVKLAGMNESYDAEVNKGRNIGKILKQQNVVLTNKKEKNLQKSNDPQSPMNIILYGPPGVGKTYSYKKLISILENGDSLEELENLDYQTLSFDTVKAESRYQFLTFHQSYSYEDFVEGFRPNIEGKIVREDGLFLELCDKAKENLEASQKNIQEIAQTLQTQELIEKFRNFVQDEFDKGNEYFLKGKATIAEIKKSSFIVGGSVTSGQNLSHKIIIRDYQDFKNGKIKSYEDIKAVFESERGVHGNASYYFALYQKLAEFEKSVSSRRIATAQSVSLKNYYLIIDEINRGNISKIFGELITLLEEDKRLGEDNELMVTLPYSKEQFGVPKNLYIIGTMNTADKSIALVDIALRRRFTFVRMEPLEEYLPENIKKINQIIKDRRGSDYLIGHAYFMGNHDHDFVMKYKIRPLLEEYFYGEDIETIFEGLL